VIQRLFILFVIFSSSILLSQENPIFNGMKSKFQNAENFSINFSSEKGNGEYFFIKPEKEAIIFAENLIIIEKDEVTTFNKRQNKLIYTKKHNSIAPYSFNNIFSLVEKNVKIAETKNQIELDFSSEKQPKFEKIIFKLDKKQLPEEIIIENNKKRNKIIVNKIQFNLNNIQSKIKIEKNAQTKVVDLR